MFKELQALEKNDTWDLVDLPMGRTVISYKWISKIKILLDGSVEQNKDQLVARV